MDRSKSRCLHITLKLKSLIRVEFFHLLDDLLDVAALLKLELCVTKTRECGHERRFGIDHSLEPLGCVIVVVEFEICSAQRVTRKTPFGMLIDDFVQRLHCTFEISLIDEHAAEIL